VELARQGIPFLRQFSIPVLYDGVEVGSHRLDLLVADAVVVELKTVRYLEGIHFAIVRSYLKAAELDVALLLNFAKTALEAKRVVARS